MNKRDYIILFGVPDSNGNVFEKGSITNLKEKGLEEDDKGVYKHE